MLNVSLAGVWEITGHMFVACDVFGGVLFCAVPFFPREVFDEILD